MLWALFWLAYVILLFVGLFYLFEKGPSWTPLLVLFIVIVCVAYQVAFPNGFEFGSLLAFVFYIILGIVGCFLWIAVIQNDLIIEQREKDAAEERRYQEYVEKRNRDR